MPRPASHQVFVQHPEFKVRQEVPGGKVNRLLVACEGHLVLPLALISPTQTTEDFGASWVQLQEAEGREHRRPGCERIRATCSRFSLR